MCAEDPDEIRMVEISAPPKLKVRDFALAQLASDHTVEDPAVVWQGTVLKSVLLLVSVRP